MDAVVIPEGLAAMPPGAGLSTTLAGIELSRVPNDQILQIATAQYRQLCHEQARMAAVMVEVGRCAGNVEPGRVARLTEPDPFGSDEIRAALRWTRHAAECEHHLAETVVHELPGVHTAWLGGDIDRQRVLVFDRYLTGLTPAQTASICRVALPRAPKLTTGQLAVLLRRMVIAVDPHAAARWYRKGIRERDVSAYLAPDGTVVLSANGLPADEAQAACERLQDLAAAAQRAGHPGLIGQIRCDLYLGMLDGRFHHMTRHQVITALITGYHETGPAGTVTQDTVTQDTVTQDTVTQDAVTQDAVTQDAVTAATVTARDAVAVQDRDLVPTPAAGQPTDTDPNDNFPSATESGKTTPADDTAAPTGTGTAPTGTPAPSGTGTAPTGTPAPSGTAVPTGTPAPSGTGTAPTDAPAPSGTAVPGGAAAPGDNSAPATVVPVRDERVGIEIRVGLATLLGHDDHPAEIPGLGLLIAPDARHRVGMQHRAQWRFAVTDTTGHLLTDGITRRRPHHTPHHTRRDGPPGGIVELHIPLTLLEQLAAGGVTASGEWAAVVADITDQHTHRDQHHTNLNSRPTDRLPGAALRRHTQIRDRTCTFPGCRRPAHACEQDHTRDHTRDHHHGGTTVTTNLGPTCPHDHTTKHNARWRITQPQPGTFIWTSPLGGIYQTGGETFLPPMPDPQPAPLRPHFDQPTATRNGPILYRPPPPPPRPPPPPPPVYPDEPPF